MVLINLSSCSLFYTTQDTPRRVDAIPLFGVKIDKSSTHGAFCVMDTTIWKEIPGYEGYYEASDTGLIRSSRKVVIERDGDLLNICSKILRPKMDKDCYLNVSLSVLGKVTTFRIHNLVALAFEIPNPENKPIVDHVNGVRWDNRTDNLRYVTQGENMQSSYDLGRKVKVGHSISQYDLQGNLIKQYRCIRDTEKDGYNSKTINKAVLGQRATAFGFIWVRNSGNNKSQKGKA